MNERNQTLPSGVYESVFCHSPLGEYLLSVPNFEILSVNDTFLRTAGRTRDDLLGKTVFEAFPPDPNDPEDSGVSALRNSLQKVVATGKQDTLAVQRYPIRVTTPDGQERYEERYWSAVNTPIHDAHGRLICIAHSTMDVTDLVRQKPTGRTDEAITNERARTEATMFTRAQTVQAINNALESERTRLRHLFEHAPGFVYFTRGPEHVIEQANAALFDLVGQRDVLGKTIREAFPEVEGQGFFEMHDEVYRTGRPVIVHAGAVRLHLPAEPDGVERIVDLVYQPIVESDGTVSGICGQGNDITEQKRAEQEVREASQRKDEFLAMLAHELRNPLAPISAAASILSKPNLDARTLTRTSEVIARQVRHMTGLVDDLLDVSRVTRGLISMSKRPEDLKQVVTNAVEQVQPMFEMKGHQLSIDLCPEAARVCGDHKRLVQIVGNLLNNACKYTPPGGHIELRMSVTDRNVILRVIDDGVGMSSELQSRVFDLFVQAERSIDRSQGGLGLGLALVKSLVQLHEGSVRCFSEGPNLGSCFTVTLPKFEPTSAQQEPAATGPLHDQGPSRRVLLAEDNADAARTLGLMLELAGHDVAIEHTAAAALERARSQPPDVCLLDIGLPDMSGHALARQLRSEPATAATFIIAITGYGQPLDREAALESGFDRYFVKPVDVDMLLAILSALPRG